MKVLFLTTYNVTLEREHFFTINVWKAIAKLHSDNVLHSRDELVLGTIVVDDYGCGQVELSEANGHSYYLLYISPGLTRSEIVETVARYFQQLKVDVVHSNMIEGYDVEAAMACNIPICLTIHIGGFICPRGGGNGFLRYDDTICNQPIGSDCTRCCACDIPFPSLTYALSRCIPTAVAHGVLSRLHRHVFYLTPLLLTKDLVAQILARIKIFKYATIFAANEKLRQLLALNGLRDNVILLPHGVEARPRLPFPSVEGNVRLFFLGRVQYSKGLHVLLQALDGIDNSNYELHVIGDAGGSRCDMRYYHSVQAIAKGKNVIFHGRIRNDEIGILIQSMHVMIHPAIFMEVYGISISESLAIGRPVIATRCGGAEMQVKEGVNGWLVEPNNVTALRRAILHVIESKTQLAGYASRCVLPHPISSYVVRLWQIYHEKTQENQKFGRK